MEITQEQVPDIYGVKFVAKDNGKEVGRTFLYVLKNDLHEEPFGFLEDVFVDESYRGKGLGKQLVQAAVAEAKKFRCYKLICTSRYSGDAHEFYKKLGFKDHGKEFRMDLRK